MICKINLRRDQELQLRNKFLTSSVTVFAPSWVRKGLILLGHHLSGVQFGVFEHFHRPVSIYRNPPKEYLTISEDFNEQSLVTLQRIARNESSNVSGIIEETLYPGIDQKVVLSIRDLVRQTVIVGSDFNSVCGGYMKPKELHERRKVYICDLAALQFQQNYKSGRLVLVEEYNHYEGILDDIIFENVVGEKRKSYQEVCALIANPTAETKKRFIKIESYGAKNASYFDTHAYSSFVKMDVVLFGVAIATMATKYDPGKKIHFKFLKYGTGFFAGRFAQILEKLILPAVLSGLDKMVENPIVKEVVNSIELPFYNCDEACKEIVAAFEAKQGVRILFTTNDALKPIDDDGVIIASTNCADSHAPLGNEMGFSSVDAAVAENLEGKGHIFCPNINIKMTEEYVDVSVCSSETSRRLPHSNPDTIIPDTTNKDSVDQPITREGDASDLTVGISKNKQIEIEANKGGSTVLITTDDEHQLSGDDGAMMDSINCADVYAPLALGDEMEFSSANAAIGETLEGKGYILGPNSNIKLTVEDVVASVCTSETSTRLPHTVTIDSTNNDSIDQAISREGDASDLIVGIAKNKQIENEANKEGSTDLIRTDDELQLSGDDVAMFDSINRADVHAPLGDEMEFSSTDAAIAEASEGMGHIFDPNSNIKLTVEDVVVSVCTSETSTRLPHTVTIDSTNKDSVDQPIAREGDASDLIVGIAKNKQIEIEANKEGSTVLITTDDELQLSGDDGVMFDSINCAEVHAPLGDEMEF